MTVRESDFQIESYHPSIMAEAASPEALKARLSAVGLTDKLIKSVMKKTAKAQRLLVIFDMAGLSSEDDRAIANLLYKVLYLCYTIFVQNLLEIRLHPVPIARTAFPFPILFPIPFPFPFPLPFPFP